MAPVGAQVMIAVEPLVAMVVLLVAKSQRLSTIRADGGRRGAGSDRGAVRLRSIIVDSVPADAMERTDTEVL
jgi:hypothetical protein